MNKPTVTNEFTISDIHKIREYNTKLRIETGKVEYNKMLNRKIAEFLDVSEEELFENKKQLV